MDAVRARYRVSLFLILLLSSCVCTYKCCNCWVEHALFLRYRDRKANLALALREEKEYRWIAKLGVHPPVAMTVHLGSNYCTWHARMHGFGPVYLELLPL